MDTFAVMWLTFFGFGVLFAIYKIVELYLDWSPASRKQQNIRYVLERPNLSPGQRHRLIQAIHGKVT